MHEAIAQLAALFPNCFRQPWEPLKIGIHNDIIARHPELRPSVLAKRFESIHSLPGLFGDDQGRRGANRPRRQPGRHGYGGGRRRRQAEDRQGGQARRGQTYCGTRWTTRPDPRRKISTACAGRTTTSRVGGPQSGRTSSPGEARGREVIQALWPLDQPNSSPMPQWWTGARTH